MWAPNGFSFLFVPRSAVLQRPRGTKEFVWPTFSGAVSTIPGTLHCVWPTILGAGTVSPNPRTLPPGNGVGIPRFRTHATSCFSFSTLS
ncbi:uncharacterized protein EI90DRAFT_3089291 [Cantharellus anzutake]|uniref:uncharacterized protein n=1 Tax=Cantharellus anzutake TaxID=1750568 RepID=UPI00190757F6|nr:uncharacterized protein EI90DRAFT_3089291 [Cantharellus anzutake]KAF8314899.1 hypothetical protein EI90DRAFT_3089291 [Cantharellus anzutake]